jgi:hypothetical protein
MHWHTCIHTQTCIGTVYGKSQYTVYRLLYAYIHKMCTKIHMHKNTLLTYMHTCTNRHWHRVLRVSFYLTDWRLCLSPRYTCMYTQSIHICMHIMSHATWQTGVCAWVQGKHVNMHARHASCLCSTRPFQCVIFTHTRFYILTFRTWNRRASCLCSTRPFLRVISR